MFRACLEVGRFTLFIVLIQFAGALPPAEGEDRQAEFHHVRLNVPDPAAAADWYVRHFDGRLVDAGSVAWGKTAIRFARSQGTAAGSKGSGLDHLGFGYGDLDAAMKRFAREKVKIVSGIEQEGPIRYAFVEDPWGTLIEAVEDPDLHGFHHVHLATTEPRQTLGWYVSHFGGKVERYRGRIGGVRYGGVWLLVKTVKRPPAPTAGRAIDRIGFRVADLSAAVNDLRHERARFENGGAMQDGLRSALFLGPDQVRVELTAQ